MMDKILLFLIPPSVIITSLITTPINKFSPLNVSGNELTSLDKIFGSDNCSYLNNGNLEESSSPDNSKNQCWWLDSGGIFSVSGGIGKTIQNELVENSYWRNEYSRTNPIDTDNGTHPQNIFRLINKNKWEDTSVETLFKISNYHLSESKNRNESNGVLLMSRFLDGDNLYYAGIRVDGTVVIKKKINGAYTTLASRSYRAVEDKKVNSIPLNQWVGEKLITKNNEDGGVDLDFYVDLSGNGEWEPMLSVSDKLETSGSPPLTKGGNVGIRSDFMDVEFSNFKIKSL